MINATFSYYVDLIHNKIKDDPQIQNIVITQGGNFFIDPTHDNELYSTFEQLCEDFPNAVKSAVMRQIDNLTAEKTTATSEIGKEIVTSFVRNQALYAQIEKNLKIIITNANRINFIDWTADEEGKPYLTDTQIITADKEETYTKSAEVYCYLCNYRIEVTNLILLPTCPNKDCKNSGNKLAVDQSTLKTGAVRTYLIQDTNQLTSTHRLLTMQAKDHFVKNLKIGDKIQLIGVFRSIRQKNKQTNAIMINAISILPAKQQDLEMPTPEQLEKFKALSKQDNYIDIITKSFAPHIYAEKLAKLCLIFSRISGIANSTQRTTLNTLLCGDPSQAKSQLLYYLTTITPNSAFASGGTATGVGLTVALDKTSDGHRYPRAGVVVLCSGSLVSIDEFNQLDDTDYENLNECMEFGTIHFNKGGFSEILPASTIITAGLNPKRYVYDFDLTIVDNLNIPIPLIDRFDLKINMVKDPLTEQLAVQHMIKMKRDGELEKYIIENNLLTFSELFVLFNYLKTLQPTFTPEAEKTLFEYYGYLEKLEQRAGSIMITKRFANSMYKLAITYAKLFFSDTVTKEHVISAIEIFKQTLKSFGMNTESEGVELKLTDQHTDAQSIFISVWRKLEKELNTEYIGERLILDRLVSTHSDFRIFSSLEKAQEFFDKQYQIGKITKKGGLYRLT